MNAKELQALLDCLVTKDEGGRLELECNFCDDITYTNDLYSSDFAGVASSLLKHVQERHPERIRPPVEPVTDEEVAEVFGLSCPLRR